MASCLTGEGCLDEARGASEVGPQFLQSVLDLECAVSTYAGLNAEPLTPHLSYFSLARTMPVTSHMRGVGARFVYILRSGRDPLRHYVGPTSDVDRRIECHNAGPCGHTRQHQPWPILVSLEFPNESAAAQVEKYLKSGSGRAFAKRHVA